MPFVKGQSGNPSGRAKITLPDGRSLQELARQHTEAAVNTLILVMADKEAPPAARIGAASAILDRGWGKPKQDIDAGENLVGMLSDLIAQGRARVAGMSSGE